MIATWLQQLQKRFPSFRQGRSTRTRRPHSFRPWIEVLEDRRVPTVFVWDGGGANNNWKTAANWDSNTDPSLATVIDLKFPAGAPADSLAMINNLGSGISINSLRFEGGGYSISQDGLTLGAGGITAITGSGTNILNVPITLAGTANDLVPFDIQGNNAVAVQLAGRVSGAAGLDKTGGGRLQLLVVNGYSGKTLVEAGTLFVHTGSVGSESPLGGTAGVTEVKAAGILALSGTASYTIQNETLLLEGTLSNRIAQNLTWKGGVTLNGDATLDMDQAGFALIIDGVIGGAAGNDLTKVGVGTVTFTGTTGNTYTGATHVNEGTLTLNKPSGATAIAGDLFIGDGTGGADSDRVVLKRFVATVPSSGSNQIDPNNNQKVVIASSGQFDLNGNNETIGTLEMSGGSVTTGTGVFSVDDEVLVHAGPTSTIAGTMRLIRDDTVGNTPFTVDANAELLVSADLTVNNVTALFGFHKLGPGRLRLTGNNTHDGPNIVEAGTLEFNNAAALSNVIGDSNNPFRSATKVLSGARLEVSKNLANDLTITENVILENGGAIFRDNQSGEFVTWAGEVVAQGSGNSIVTITKNIIGLVNEFTITGKISGDGDLTLHNVTVAGTTANTISGHVSVGRVDFSKPANTDAVGAGASIGVGDANGFPQGKLVLTAGNQIPDNVPVRVNEDDLLDLQNHSETIGALTLEGGTVQTGTGTLTVTGDITALPENTNSNIHGNLNLGNSDNSRRLVQVGDAGSTAQLVIDAVISGGGIDKQGIGTLELNASNLFRGTFLISQGEVDITNANALGEPAAFSSFDVTLVEPGASLHLQGSTYTVSEPFQIEGTGVNGEGAISNSSSVARTIAGEITLTDDAAVGVASKGGQLTLDGLIDFGNAAFGINNFTKVGPGTLVLAGAVSNNILGDWIVTEGTLVLDKGIGIDAVNNRLVIGDGTGTDIVRLDNDVQIPDATQVVVNSSGRLDYNDETDQIGLLTLHGGRLEGTTGTLFLNNKVVADVTNNQVPTINGNIGLTSGTHEFNVADDPNVVNDMVINGRISGTGNLTKTGLGRLEFQGSTDNTYSGETRVNEGTLSLAKPGANEVAGIAIAGKLIVGESQGAAQTDLVLYQADGQVADNKNVTVLPSGHFNLNNHSDTIGSLTMTAGLVDTGTGVLTVNAGDVTINAANVPAMIRGNLDWTSSPRIFQVANGGAENDLVIAANLLSTGTAIFHGTGTTLLTGTDQSLNGLFVDTGGTVLLNSTLGGNVTLPLVSDVNGNLFVNTFGGTGTVNGNVTVAVNNRLSPGDNNGPETLNVLGSLTFSSTEPTPTSQLTSALVVEVDGLAGPGAVGGHDQLIVAGGVTLGTRSELRIELGFTPTADQEGHTFVIIQNLSNTLVSGQFTNAPDSPTDGDAISDVTISVGGKEFFVDYGAGEGGNDIALIYHAGANEAEPVLTPIGDKAVNEGGTLSFAVQATDADGDQLTFRLAEGAPAGASIDPITGQFAFTATDGPAADPVVVTVIVSDNGFPAFEAAETFLITVNNVAPTLDAGPDGGIARGSTFTSQGTIRDLPEDLLVVTVNYGDGTGDQPLPIKEDGTFDLNHVYTNVGVFTVTVTGSDDDGGQVIDTARVSVAGLPVVVPPPVAAPPPAVAALLSSIGSGKKKKLGVRVQFGGGLPSREIVSPFQKPKFQAVAAALHDLNGDGVFDSVRFTARRGGKKLTRVIAL
jgi:fibronectin-binding autotransporter adhesin